MPDFSALSSLAGRAISAAHCRMVPRATLALYSPPRYLYTSGRPNRYNPRGVNCVYCSEDMPTAGAEYERYRLGSTAESTTFWIHPQVLVLDLGDVSNVAALGLSPADLFAPWKGLNVTTPTLTQQLGASVAAQTRISGIRYPSDAARSRGLAGFNLVLFHAAVVTPAVVEVKDDAGAIVGRWP